MTLDDLNALNDRDASALLLKCCGSPRWAASMSAERPFLSLETLLSHSETVWWQLQPADWLEAFSAHPNIGEKKSTTAWSSQEQSGIESASELVLEHIAEKNEDYRRQFGWIFLINATGKSADQMLSALEIRLQNQREDELRIAAAEQAQITNLRLLKLMNE